VVLNLLQNAADAMAGGETRRITVVTSRDQDRVRVSVADSGPGLTPEAASHLFEPFFTTKPEGLGLGLSLSRGFVEAHGGRLWAESTPGGARFAFTLPVCEDTP
jgi:signal transduction histidine kinase